MTPSGGQHLWFGQLDKPIRSRVHGLGPGIDVIGGDSGVMAPPSHRSEGAYRWRTPGAAIPESFTDLPRFPQVLAERLQAVAVKRATNHVEALLPSEINDGAR